MLATHRTMAAAAGDSSWDGSIPGQAGWTSGSMWAARIGIAFAFVEMTELACRWPWIMVSSWVAIVKLCKHYGLTHDVL